MLLGERYKGLGDEEEGVGSYGITARKRNHIGILKGKHSHQFFGELALICRKSDHATSNFAVVME
jgi:hypothetical protein